MTHIATIVCLLLAAGTVVLTGYRALRDQLVASADLAAAALLEFGVLCYVVARIVDLVHGPHPASVPLALAYLLGIALVLPIAALLALAERSRWGPVVLGTGALVVSVLFARIDQVWRPHG